MTRICMVAHSYYYRDARIRRYAESLAGAGVHVDVLCLSDRSRPTTHSQGPVKLFQIPLGRIANGFGGYILEYAAALFLFSARLLELHIRNHYDAIHVHNVPDFLILTCLIPRFLRAKLILDIHDPMPELYMSKFRLRGSSVIVKIVQIQERLSALLAHKVIAASMEFKKNISGRGTPAGKISVINNFPDPGIFDPAAYDGDSRHRKEHFTLVYPGTIAPRYGLDVAIRAMPGLVQEIPELRLVVIGRQGKYASELAALATDLGVSESVIFKPSVPVELVPAEIASADVGIYPALPDPHMRIAMPVKVLEYAVMGIPIVASRLMVLQDRFDDSAVLFFDPGNVAQFTRCITDLYGSPVLRAKLAGNARSIVTRTCRWETERQVYFDLLNLLLGPRHSIPASRNEHGGLNTGAT